MLLPTLCQAQMGYTARSRLETLEEGGVPAIQLRDLRGEEDFSPEGLPSYALGPSFNRYWVKPGDVLFRSRGERNTAAVISLDSNAAAVAISPLIILRPNRELIDGRFLAWFINQPEAQLHFDKCARGTRLRMIPKSCLDRLEVPVPDLETQRRIVEIDALAKREHELSKMLADKKLEFTSFALLQQVRKAQPHSNGTGQSAARRALQNSAGKSERTNT